MSMHLADRSAAPMRSGDPFGSTTRQLVWAVAASAILFVTWLAVPLELLPVAIPGVILSLLLAITYPAPLCIAFLFLTYFKVNEISPMLVPLTPILSLGSALTVVALMWHLLLARTVRLDLTGPPAMIVAFWLLTTASMITARDLGVAYQAWSDYSKTLLLSLAVICFIRTTAQLRAMTHLFVLGGMLLALSVAENTISSTNLVEGTRATAGSGALSNPNDVALLLLLPLALAVTSVLKRGGMLTRLLALIAVAAIIYAIILTQSRGGLFGLLAVLAVIGSRYVKSKVMLLVLGTIVGVGLYAAMGIASRESGGDNDVQGESARDRIFAWQAGINMAKAYPLTGVGIGNFVHQFSTYTPEETLRPITAHSIWFLVLGEIGIPGFMAFLVIVIGSLQASYENSRKFAEGRAPPILRGLALAVMAGLVGYLVAGSFLSYVYQWPLYVYVALIVAMTRLRSSTM